MPRADTRTTTIDPAAKSPFADRYVRATMAILVAFHQPGPTHGSEPHAITGHLLGTMNTRSQIHHHRVAGNDGVLYLVPPAWLGPVSQNVAIAAVTP